MTCSPARLAANRRNAQLSSGPRTVEGKAASRLNAFRHGGAGAGDLLAPGEDEAAVDRRVRAFGAELGIEDEVGWTLARRAALLSVRMELAAARELVAVRANVAVAHAEFDQDLADEADRLIAILEGGDDPQTTLAELAGLPAGVAYLIDAWGELRTAIAAGDQAAVTRAGMWLREDGARSASFLARIDAELVRLRAEQVVVERVSHRLRNEAGVLAGFDPSPAATLARRYEAAAERGMYRALRAIAEHHAAPVVDPALTGSRPVAPVVVPPPVPESRALATAPAEPSPLGSFGAEGRGGSISPVRPLILDAEPSLMPTPTRKERPNLARIAHQRR